MSKKKIIIIAGIAFIVLAMIGGGFFMLWQKLSALGNLKAGGDVKTEAKQDKESMGHIFSLESFIVNLSDEGGKRYLRVTMGLEVSDPKASDELTKRLPQIRDRILMILPTRKVGDLQTAEGKNSLRSEIAAELNELFGKEIVKKIYFTEFVIQ